MIDVEKEILDHIESFETTIETALGVNIRVYASVEPPNGYNPADDGPCVLLGIRGGSQDYSSAILSPSVQIRCFAATENLAKKLDKALYTAINDSHGDVVLHCYQQELGQLLIQPDVDWPFVLSYYLMVMRNG